MPESAEPPAVELVKRTDLEPESDTPETDPDEEAAQETEEAGEQGSESEGGSDSRGVHSVESAVTEIEPTDAASDDLDLDALIAEVESAGLEDEPAVETPLAHPQTDAFFHGFQGIHFQKNRLQ